MKITFLEKLNAGGSSGIIEKKGMNVRLKKESQDKVRITFGKITMHN